MWDNSTLEQLNTEDNSLWGTSHREGQLNTGSTHHRENSNNFFICHKELKNVFGSPWKNSLGVIIFCWQSSAVKAEFLRKNWHKRSLGIVSESWYFKQALEHSLAVCHIMHTYTSCYKQPIKLKWQTLPSHAVSARESGFSLFLIWEKMTLISSKRLACVPG